MSKNFVWRTRSGEKEIKDLEGLLEALLALEQEEIDEAIRNNVLDGKLIGWLRDEFPDEVGLLAGLEAGIKEHTPQQLREMLVRHLRRSVG